MGNRLRIGIIGTGHMGQYHVNVATQLQEGKLVGIYDNDEARSKLISEKYKTKSFSSIDTLLENSDAVIIASPTFTHFEIAKDALQKGKHVLVEKPISETLEQAKILVDLSEKNKLILLVGHVERFNGAVLELSKIIKDPIFIESRRLAPFNPRIKDVGVVLDMMIHDIDIVLNLIKSDVVSIQAQGNKVFTNFEDIANVLLKFENGCIANITASRCTQSKVRILNVSQKENYVCLDFANQEIELHKQTSLDVSLKYEEIRYKQESVIEKIFVHKDNPLKLEQEHFVSCINGETIPIVSGKSDIKTLEIAHQILEQIHQKGF